MTITQRMLPAVLEFLGPRTARLLGLMPPCMPERTVHELSFIRPDEATRLAESFSCHVVDAAVCLEDHVFSARKNTSCPKCGSTSWMYLSTLNVTPVNTELSS